ncbi:hypothetical protein DFH29DRAFT_883270 [Suillus ampliporus]|nr:hypothetical protein DFH29DRAFT_883270 [Suillus ampliporus]
MAMQVPLWLYFPKKNQALQVIQLPHPLDRFNGCYVLVGYVAHNHCQISPLYGPECEMVPVISLGFSNISLPIVGILAVPQGSGDTGFHTVYERQLGDGDFLRVVVTKFCQPDASGRPSEVWLLNALDHTIQFHEAPFPYGFPPSAPLATIEVAPILHVLQLFAPAMIDQELTSLMPSVTPSLVGDVDYSCYTDDSLMQFETTQIEYFGTINTFPPSIHFPPSSIRQLCFTRTLSGEITMETAIIVTKAIYVGSYWVGLQNPFDFLEKLPEALEKQTPTL